MKSYAELKRIEKEVGTRVKRSKSAYCRRDHKAEQTQADKIAALLAPLGISVDWPGLDPCFKFQAYDYYDISSALNAFSQEG